MSDDIEELRRSLLDAQAEIEALRNMHEADLTRVRLEADEALVLEVLRTEAMRLGAHDPDDVVRLIGKSDAIRVENGRPQGVGEAVEALRQERQYLFLQDPPLAVAQGSTRVSGAPRPAPPEVFDARSVSEAEYSTRKWQFLSAG